MDTVLSLIELFAYIAAILALSMSVTWLVVRVSPSESAKEQRAKGETKGST
jgi:flagellar biogenesis protein FliO